MRKPIPALILILGAAACGGAKSEAPAPAAAPPTQAKSAADLEKEKAMAHPFPADLGPDSLDVAAAPKLEQEGYAALRAKCSTCHSAARPLNHRFTEPDGADKAARTARVEALKKSAPELFADAAVWQIEAGLWQRYVKRMMAKPGCTVTDDDAKKIWKFLVWQSETHKLGAARAAWKKHRQDLVARFKTEHPKRFAELEHSGGL